MKTNAERAQERLTLTPKTEFTLKKDGFIGALYQPEQDEYPGKAVIMFGGSDGIYNLRLKKGTDMNGLEFAVAVLTVIAVLTFCSAINKICKRIIRRNRQHDD